MYLSNDDGNLGSNATQQTVASSLPKIGSVVGGPIGNAVGTVIGAALSIFGGKTHYTPSGLTYKQAAALFRTTHHTVENLTNQLEQIKGEPLTQFIPEPSNGDSPEHCELMTKWVSFYLNDPSLDATTNSCNVWDSYKKNGTLDSAIGAQAAYLKQLQQNITDAQNNPLSSLGSIGGFPMWIWLAGGATVALLLARR